MIKRLICCLAAVMMMLIPVLSYAETTFTMAGYDGEDTYHDWSTNGFFVRMQEKSGISFEFREFTKMTEWQQYKTVLADGKDLPDVLFKAALTPYEQMDLSDKGILIDLLPLLEENCPNLWKLLQENPDWLKAITLPDGKVVSLPALQPVPAQDAMWINQEWLDKLHLEMPTDPASLREVLIAFRDRDPNGNGKKDEVPMLFLGPWELKFFSHAWGVVSNDYNIWLDENGKVQYWPMDDRFFEMIAWLRELYEDGLLDKNGFTTADTLRQVTDQNAAVTYGAMFAPNPMNLVTYNMTSAYKLMKPFVYEGNQVYRDLFGSVTRGTFAITSACSDPAALLRWVDILYSDEGGIETMSGKIDTDYVVDEDGFWNWPGGVDSNTSAMLQELTLYDSGDMPWLFPQEHYMHYEEKVVRDINQQLAELKQYCVRPFPYYTLTKTQSDEVMQLQNVLGMYVDKAITNFVTGRTELTETSKQAFLNDLNTRGVQKMIDFWQNIADNQ